WDGTSWTVVPTPDVGSNSSLLSVAATSASSAWAVGRAPSAAGRGITLIEHWDGTSWSVVPSPSPGTGDADPLASVAATSASNAWAVGSTRDASGATRPLIERWDGTSWTVVPSANPGSTDTELASVTATSASNAWAVGFTLDATGLPTTLTEHWDG